MRGWVPRTTARAAAVTLALVMGVVGSAVDGGRGRASAAADPASTAPPCELPVGDQNLGDADGALVILLDGSTSSAEQPDRATELGRLLDTATADDALMVSIGSFGGSDAEVRFSPCLDGVLFVPDGNNHRTARPQPTRSARRRRRAARRPGDGLRHERPDEPRCTPGCAVSPTTQRRGAATSRSRGRS